MVLAPLLLSLIGGCTSAGGDGAESTPPPDTDSGGDSHGESGDDTNHDSAAPAQPGDPPRAGAPEAPCPEGTAPITDSAGAVAYCIHLGEARVVSGSWGSSDQHKEGAEPASDIVLESGLDVRPTSGVTYDQAVTICESSGGTLATYQEWQDALDGVLGEGGEPYPYGTNYDRDVCATNDNPASTAGPYPTGTFPGCVSPFGVYDGLGNEWEWFRSEEFVDIDAWLARARDEYGIDIRFADDPDVPGERRVEVAPDQREELDYFFQAAMLVPWVLDRSKEYTGLWYDVKRVEAWAGDPPVGLLRIRAAAATGESLLPVWLWLDEEDPTVGHFVLADIYDGAEWPGKGGGAWYTEPTAIYNPFIGHVWDFNGTIAFRCVYPPRAR